MNMKVTQREMMYADLGELETLHGELEVEIAELKEKIGNYDKEFCQWGPIIDPDCLGNCEYQAIALAEPTPDGFIIQVGRDCPYMFTAYEVDKLVERMDTWLVEGDTDG
jgi:hypothetical protein